MNFKVSSVLRRIYCQYSQNRPLQVCNLWSYLNANQSVPFKSLHAVSYHAEYISQNSGVMRREYHTEGFFNKVKETFNFTIHGYPTTVLTYNGIEIYNHISVKLQPDVSIFLEACDLPDTLQSWFIINELHVWMLCVRLMAEDAPGKMVRKILLKALWKDVEARAKKIGKIKKHVRGEQIEQLGFQMFRSFWSYDEALNGDDKVLAAALWNRFLDNAQDKSDTLEALVHYVRKNIAILENIPTKVLFNDGDKSEIILSRFEESQQEVKKLAKETVILS